MATPDKTSHDHHGVTAHGMNRRNFVGAGATAAVGAMTLAQSSTSAEAKPEKPVARGSFWPNGARLAIAFSMVIETDADPDPTTKGPDGKVYPDLYATTARQYARREAIPRMLDMFDRRRIKITSMMCGLSCERNPDLAKEIAQRGHECGAHGAAHNLQFQLPRDDERAFIKEAADQIEKATGQRPVGYNCRGQLRSPNTLSLAQELGLHLSHRRHQPRRAVHRAGQRQAVCCRALYGAPQRHRLFQQSRPRIGLCRGSKIGVRRALCGG